MTVCQCSRKLRRTQWGRLWWIVGIYSVNIWSTRSFPQRKPHWLERASRKAMKRFATKFTMFIYYIDEANTTVDCTNSIAVYFGAGSKTDCSYFGLRIWWNSGLGGPSAVGKEDFKSSEDAILNWFLVSSYLDFWFVDALETSLSSLHRQTGWNTD